MFTVLTSWSHSARSLWFCFALVFLGDLVLAEALPLNRCHLTLQHYHNVIFGTALLSFLLLTFHKCIKNLLCSMLFPIKCGQRSQGWAIKMRAIPDIWRCLHIAKTRNVLVRSSADLRSSQGPTKIKTEATRFLRTERIQ